MYRLFVILLMATLAAHSAVAQEDEPAEPEEPAESLDESGAADVQPSPAVAKEKRLLIVFDTRAAGGVDAVEAGNAGGVIRNSLSSGSCKIVTDAQLAAGAGEKIPDEVEADLERAKALVKRGRERLLDLALDDASDAFLSARVILRRRMLWLDGPDLYIDALMGLAETLATSGRKDDARAAYREILSVSPNYVPDPGQVPGKFRALFDQASKNMSGTASGSITVGSEPAGAMVELDGLQIGRTPTTKEGVPDGLHSLHISLAGYRTVRKIVALSAGESKQVDEKLSSLEGSHLVSDIHQELSGAGSPEKLSSLARELARSVQADAVVLSQLGVNDKGNKTLTVAIIPAASGSARILGLPLGNGNVVDLGPELAGRLSEALASGTGKLRPPGSLGMDFSKRLLGEPAKEQVATTSLVRLPKKPKIDLGATGGTRSTAAVSASSGGDVSLFKRWWFWTAVGGAAATILATTLALTLGGGEKTVHDPDLIHITIERIGQ